MSSRHWLRAREREKWPNEYWELLDTPYFQLRWYLAVLFTNRKYFPLFTKDQSESRQGARLDVQICLNRLSLNPHRLAVGCGCLFYVDMHIPHSSIRPQSVKTQPVLERGT